MAFEQLQPLALGLVGFAIIVGVGTLILWNFGGSVGQCPIVDGNQSVWNATSTNGCDTVNGTVGATLHNGSSVEPSGTAWDTTDYLNTQLGSTGLAGWVPAIIAITVGMMFLGYFMFRKGRKF